MKYSIGFIPVIITCFSIYSLSSNSYGQNLIDPSQFLTPIEVEKPIVSISTNKFQYLPGETIIISGSAFNTTGAVNSIITLGVLYGEDSSVLTPDNKAFTGNLTYKTDIRVINGSFTFSSYSSHKEGYYTIVAAFKEQTSGPTIQASELPFAQVRVVNPIFTVPYWMLLFAIACFILLIIVILRSGRLDFATGEILRFVLITGIVASPIIALLFSDSELGINSPISLILKPDVSKDQDALDAIWKNQWFIAVGGMKIDNYMSGILIPFYVIVFGLAGGYLRYLYSTSIKLWNLERSSDATTNNVKIPLFNWNKVPDDQEELIKFKSFLINSFGANWIKEGNIRRENDKIISSSKDQLETITIEAIPSENIAIIKLGDVTYGKLRLEKKQTAISMFTI